MTNTSDPTNIIGNNQTIPTSKSFLINSEAYVRATNTSWASYQMGIIAPFSLVGIPAIKYGDTVSYKAGFAFFGNPNTTSVETSNVTLDGQSSN